VKQFDPNKEEKKLHKQLLERGYTDAYGGELAPRRASRSRQVLNS